ncbi:MAG: MFS transporter, partial [Candidatus Bathyarchaeia archaeon]
LAVPAVLTMKHGLANAGKAKTLPDGNRESVEGSSLRDAVSSKSFWIFYVVYAVNAVCFTLVLVHLAPFATDMGFELTTAGLILSLAGLGNFVGRFLFMPPLVHLTAKTVLFLTAIFQAVLIMFLLTLGTYGGVVIVYALLFGIFYGAVIPQYPLLAERYYGPRAYSAVFGILSTAFGVGGFIGPLTGGFIHDLSGSYNLAFIMLGALFAFSALFSLLLRPPSSRRGVPHVLGSSPS